MRYNKPALTINEQIAQLKERGMLVRDEEYARHFLSQISYYRLAGYWWSMQQHKTRHTFKPYKRFEDVIALYNFDRQLRIILFKAIEKIEISLRTRLIYHLSHEFDPWWFEDSDKAKKARYFRSNLEAIKRELDRSHDTFIKEHKKKYSQDDRFPPAWKTLEVVSIGTLSKLYRNLTDKSVSKDEIAHVYGLPNHTYLISWLRTITEIRNHCAHHNRLWNKNFPTPPKMLKKPAKPWLIYPIPRQEQQRIFTPLCCIKYMLNTIDPENQQRDTLKALFNKYPTVNPKTLGMRTNWLNEPVWKSSKRL